VIVEERTYTCHPGKVPEFLRLAEAHGLPVLKPTLGNLIGYFHTEVGTLNQVVHLWAYASLGDRERRRAELAKSDDYKAFVAMVTPLIQTMESRILIPAPFNTLPLMPDGGDG